MFIEDYIRSRIVTIEDYVCSRNEDPKHVLIYLSYITKSRNNTLVRLFLNLCQSIHFLLFIISKYIISMSNVIRPLIQSTDNSIPLYLPNTCTLTGTNCKS